MDFLLASWAVLFWLCFGLVMYAYLGYPLLIWCFARWFGHRNCPPELEESELPTMSLLIAAFNEEAVIEERIRNALAMDYPREKLEIAVGSDGSTDATVEIVRRFADRGVRLFDFSRRGKAGVLNAAIPKLKGDILLLSDANTYMQHDAPRKLARWFKKPEVGSVCGRLVLIDSPTGGNADGFYWKYETFLKKSEGSLGALLGVNGAIYSIRRHLFVPIPITPIDDFILPLLAKLNSNCAIVYESKAVAWEETAPDIGSEFRRRSRFGAGGFQSLGLLWRLLDPRRGWIAFTLFSHKLLRWLCPFFLLGMLATNLLLCAQPFYQFLLIGQTGFYLTAFLASFIPAWVKFSKPLRLATMFSVMNVALLVGFCRWARQNPQGIWQSTIRTATPNEAVG
jgi:cellulose synthase/poly-beta-1,6-N-acetylglucosamine synthase-like glycosyltransferase